MYQKIQIKKTAMTSVDSLKGTTAMSGSETSLDFGDVLDTLLTFYDNNTSLCKPGVMLDLLGVSINNKTWYIEFRSRISYSVYVRAFISAPPWPNEQREALCKVMEIQETKYFGKPQIYIHAESELIDWRNNSVQLALDHTIKVGEDVDESYRKLMTDFDSQTRFPITSEDIEKFLMTLPLSECFNEQPDIAEKEYQEMIEHDDLPPAFPELRGPIGLHIYKARDFCRFAISVQQPCRLVPFDGMNNVYIPTIDPVVNKLIPIGNMSKGQLNMEVNPICHIVVGTLDYICTGASVSFFMGDNILDRSETDRVLRIICDYKTSEIKILINTICIQIGSKSSILSCIYRMYRNTAAEYKKLWASDGSKHELDNLMTTINDIALMYECMTLFIKLLDDSPETLDMYATPPRNTVLRRLPNNALSISADEFADRLDAYPCPSSAVVWKDLGDNIVFNHFRITDPFSINNHVMHHGNNYLIRESPSSLLQVMITYGKIGSDDQNVIIVQFPLPSNLSLSFYDLPRIVLLGNSPLTLVDELEPWEEMYSKVLELVDDPKIIENDYNVARGLLSKFILKISSSESDEESD